MSEDSSDRKNNRSLGGFLSSMTIFGNKPRKVAEAAPAHFFTPAPKPIHAPSPTNTPRETLNTLKAALIQALDQEDFVLFSEKMEKLRDLADRGIGNLPAFTFYYSMCREIHGPEKFVNFFDHYLPDDPIEIFNKHPETVHIILGITIKLFQFESYLRRGLPIELPAYLQEKRSTLESDEVPTNTTFAG